MNGRFISGPAAVFILLFFFLPWVTVSCNGIPGGELSGYDLARGSSQPNIQTDAPVVEGQPLLFVIPVAGLVTLALIALVWRNPAWADKVAWGQAGVTFMTLLILLWQYLQVQPEQEAVYELVTQPALWGTLLGLVLILIGAVVDIVSHYQTPRYAHSTSRPTAESPPDARLPTSQPEPAPEVAEPHLFTPAFFPQTAVPEHIPEQAKEFPGTPAPIPPGRLSPKTEMLQPESNILAWLIVREGEETGKQHRLRENMIIGRDPDCDIIVQDSAVSGKHIRVYVENGRFFAADLNSTNGAFVHEPQPDRWSKIQEIEMKDGTQIKLGRTILHLMTLTNK